MTHRMNSNISLVCRSLLLKSVEGQPIPVKIKMSGFIVDKVSSKDGPAVGDSSFNKGAITNLASGEAFSRSSPHKRIYSARNFFSEWSHPSYVTLMEDAMRCMEVEGGSRPNSASVAMARLITDEDAVIGALSTDSMRIYLNGSAHLPQRKGGVRTRPVV